MSQIAFNFSQLLITLTRKYLSKQIQLCVLSISLLHVTFQFSLSRTKGIFDEQSTKGCVRCSGSWTDRDRQTDEADTRTTALRFLYQSNQHL